MSDASPTSSRVVGCIDICEIFLVERHRVALHREFAQLAFVFVIFIRDVAELVA